jgi:hypothetical protein
MLKAIVVSFNQGVEPVQTIFNIFLENLESYIECEAFLRHDYLKY